MTPPKTHFAERDISIRGQMVSWALLAGQLAAAIAVVHIYDLETDLHLRDVLLWTALGLVCQTLLPRKWWPFTLAMICVAGLFGFAGPANASVTLMLGTAILFLANLSIKWIRWTSLLLVFGSLATVYVILPVWAEPFTPAMTTLGVMFMYRLLIFLYDRHQAPSTPLDATDLTYFFLLPNMAMSLFPAVDYRHFRQHVDPARRILVWKKGMFWVVTGVFHLVIYRWVYHHLLLPAGEVRDLLGLARYTFFNYALILRLSGLFHLAVGVLGLLGFDLPRVFHHYFLATGFSDLWRRINIYFRDFLVKVFYYPIYFRLRSWGNVRAVPVAILLLFVITWFLHSIQWFWIKGQFPLRIQDGIFWGLFGVLVAINAWWEIKYRTSHSLTGHLPTRAFTQVTRIAGMLVFMSLLWSLWTAPSLDEWWLRIRTGLISPVSQYVTLSLTLVCLLFAGTVAWLVVHHFRLARWLDPEPSSSVGTFWSAILLMLLLAFPWVAPALQRSTDMSMAGILTEKLSDADEIRRIEGYYNHILTGHQLTDPLAGRKNLLPDTENDARIYTGDFRHISKKPDMSILLKGQPFTTNAWGMRDDPLSEEKPEGSVRILLMGGSFVVGSGVADHEVFDRRLEALLQPNKGKSQYEFINTATASYDLVDCILQFEVEEFQKFHPDILMFFTHGIDGTKTIRDMARQYKAGVRMPYLFMDVYINRAGLRRDMSEEEMVLLLEPFTSDILEDGYQKLREVCDTHHIRPVWVFWPPIARAEAALEEKALSKQIARNLGFELIDLEPLYKGLDPESLTVSRFDMHPNALAHSLMADTLAKVLIQRSLLPNPR